MGKSELPILHLAFATVLIIVEVLLLSLTVDARTIKGDGLVFQILAEGGNFLRWSIASVGVLALGLANNFTLRLSRLTSYRSTKSILLTVVVHIVLFSLLFFSTPLVFNPNKSAEGFLVFLWILLVGLVFVSWCLIVTRARNWVDFIQFERITILVAIAGGTIIFLLSLWSRKYWGSLSGFTLDSSRFLLELIYDDIVFDKVRMNLGVESFWVNIAPVCSGIEGMVLAFSTSAIYLFLARHYLKFPRALVLLPAACLISIALNLVRIVTLIVIGAEFSPALAIGGFHSVAGWITSVIVALLIVFVFSTWSWIQKSSELEKDTHRRANDAHLAIATLVPFVIFAGISLVSGIFITSFDYAYPVKVIVVSISITYFWHHYKIPLPRKILEPLVIGLCVAALWVATFPTDEQQNKDFVEGFKQLSLWGMFVWATFRLIGFWMIAPVLEELVFRGYLLCRISGQEYRNNDKLKFSLVALIVSSALFGLLHSGWTAGFLAGACFAILRFRSESISEPILAHSSANIFVAAWAYYTGNWALI